MFGFLIEKIVSWLWIKWMTLNGIYTAANNHFLIIKTLMLVLAIAYFLDGDWGRFAFQALLLAIEGLHRLDRKLKAKEDQKEE